MKKLLAILLTVVLSVATLTCLTACDPTNQTGGKTLTVWGPTEQQETLKTMVASFKEANPDLKDVTINVGVCSEGDAHANVSKDPSAAADVYAFANDQIVNLVRVGALAEVAGIYKDEIIANNGEGAVKAGQFDGKQYAYPYSADNGYFMYYDKSVITEEEAGSLEKIIAKCEQEKKTIGWPLDDSWYVAGWFFTFGGNYSVEYNEDGSEKSVVCTFNDTVNGIKAAKGMAKLASSTAFAGAGTSNDTITTGIGDTMAVAITGTWNAEAIEGKLGDNYGVAKLPTVTVDGETKQLSSFAGYKLYGVNPHSKDLATAHKLAAYLSSEEMQLLRFKNHKIGPSNTKAAANAEVQANPALAALSAQNAYAVAQTAVPANFWDPVKAFGVAIIGGLAEAEYQEKLNDMVKLIVPKAVLDFPYLVGGINGWNKDETPRKEAQKFTTTDPDKKIWTLEYTFVEPVEVKAILVDTNGNGSWPEGNTPNAVIAEAGTYVLTFDVDTGVTTAEKKA